MNIAQHLTGIELDKLYATAQFYIFPVPFCDFANSLFLAKGDGDMPISVHRRCRASSISLVCCHKKYFIFFRMESSFICCHKKIKNKKKYLRSCGWSIYFVYLQVQGGSLHPHHLKRILKKITWGQKSDLGFQIYGSLFSPIPVKGSIRDSLQLPRRFKECKGKAAIGARNRGYRILLLKVFFKGFSSLGISMFNN